MTWGLAIAALSVVIAWRRPRVDRVAVAWLFVAVAGVVLYTYRSLGS